MGSAMIEAEFEEIEEAEAQEDQLDLTEDDSLPWLEADDDDHGGGGFDIMQFAGFAAILLALMAVIVGGIWFFSNRNQPPELVADGSTIEAPEGPYKVKPDEPGGKEFAGTGNVAPAVGEGQTPDGKVADNSGSDDAATGGASGASGGDTPKPSVAIRSTDEASSGSSSSSVVGVQVAAYGSRARAEAGWAELTRNSSALEGVRYRVVKGQADIGTVYRLQALASNRAAADKLCSALKADGLNCQVKP